LIIEIPPGNSRRVLSRIVFEYKGPVAGEELTLEDGKEDFMEKFQNACIGFLRGVDGDQESRDGLVGEVKAGYAGLEPFVRAKTHYHRAGFIV
jgi:hypothetical protein